MKHVGNMKLIAYGFLLFYGITFLSYVPLFGHPLVRGQAFVMALIFLILLWLMLGVLHWQEWARRALVQYNMGLCVVSLIFWYRNPALMPLPYALISFITAAFYSQKPIRAYFQPVEKLVRKSVLIVDDDEGVLRTVQKILLPNGYSVLTALTGEKGMQITKLQKPDLVILDVLLPGIKGREVCAVLKEDPATKNIPVLFLTAKDSPDDIDAEMAVGATAHLAKPVNSKILLAEVRRIIG